MEDEEDLEEEKLETTTTLDQHTEQHVPQTNNELSEIQFPNSQVELVYVQETQNNEDSDEEREILVVPTLRNAEFQGTVVEETQLDDLEGFEDRFIVPLAKTNTRVDSSDETEDGFQES